MKFFSFSNRLKECGTELGPFLTGLIPANDVELESFISKKRDIYLELHNIRVIKDRC